MVTHLYSAQPLVLIVDDSEDTRRLLRRVMQQEGYRVVEAANGEVAVQTFLEYHPDVVLMDAKMPVLDGFTACQQIRALPQSNNTPIIMVTSLEDKDSIQHAFAVGATDYITKPISPIILKHRMRHFLHSRTLEKNLAMRNQVLELLNRASQAAASSLDTQESLRQIILVAGEALQVNGAYVYAYHRQDVTVIAEYLAAQAPAPSCIEQTYSLGKMPAIAHWLQSPTDFWVFQLDTDDSLSLFERDRYAQAGVKSVMVVPFYIEQQLFGYLEFWQINQVRDFSVDDIAMVIAMANQVGVSINNTQLHSALKQSENELRRYAAELEVRNRELDAYTYTIAHDIKTPLQAILNYIVVAVDMQAGDLLPDAANLLQKAQDQVQDMGMMVDQLLLLTTIGDTDDAGEAIEMRAVIQRVLKRFESSLNQAHVQVVVADFLPEVLGNHVWLQEVLANLVSNAIKYLGRDNPDPRIWIEAAVIGAQVRYSVRDNGIGIAPSNLQRIFNMFTRVDQTDGHGFGLGLSIVDRLVKKMKGRVGVESEQGKGSTFWFILPTPE